MIAAKESWRIEGRYFESCNCEVLCPCLLSHAQARPTEGHCDVVLATHINRGNYGQTDISGLTAVQALMTPDAMGKGGGTLAVYVDGRANSEQRAALEAIFTGKAGGPPALLSGMVAKWLPTKAVEISFSEDGKTWKFAIPDIADVAVEGLIGAGNQVVWLENIAHPFSSRLAVAKGAASHYKDHSLAFENSGRNGHFSAVNWSNA